MRILAALSMLGLLVLATTGAKITWPSSGEYLFESDSTAFSSASTDTLIDSLRCPNGHVITRLVVRADVVGAQKLLLGFDRDADPDSSVSDVDSWAYLHNQGSTIIVDEDAGEVFEFFPGCERIFIKAGGTSSGKWSWDAYSVLAGPDTRTITYPTTGTHAPPLRDSDIFTLIDVEPGDYGGSVYFRINSTATDDVMAIFMMKDYNWAWFCPDPPWSAVITATYCVGYALDVDSTSTPTRLWIAPNTKHNDFDGMWITYTGLGRYTNGGSTIQGVVWEYKE